MHVLGVPGCHRGRKWRGGLTSIVPYGEISDDRQRNAEIDAIFFEASSRQSFEDDQARHAFRRMWLGRYLEQEPEHAFVALDGDGRVCGYLVGSLDDPAQRPEFAELTYFRDFARETARFPAHLHINVDREARSRGIGAALIEAFAGHLARQGATGVHVVTGLGARNVRFYERLGFSERGRATWHSGEVVLLGRRLK